MVRVHLSPLPSGKLHRLLDGKALAVLCHVGFPLLWRHLVEQHVWTLELDTFKVIQRPHVLVIEDDVRLRNEGLAIGTDET